MLVLQGELQRQSIALEQLMLQRRLDQAREGLQSHRWWVVAATVAVAGSPREKRVACCAGCHW